RGAPSMFQPFSAVAEFVGAIRPPHEIVTDALFVPVFDDEGADAVAALDDATGGEWARAAASGEFRGRAHEVFGIPLAAGRWNARRVFLIGGGQAQDLDAEHVRRIASVAGYVARQRAV